MHEQDGWKAEAQEDAPQLGGNAIFERKVMQEKTWNGETHKEWALDNRATQKVLGSLKNGKCRDPQGLINELFKPGVSGKDFQYSLLHMLNNIKETLIIPDMMKNVNVAMIPKPGKPGLHDLENH